MALASSKRVLVVEDESDVRDLILLHLKREGHDADFAADGEGALQKLEKSAYDLLILDWMLPGFTGLDLVRELRGGMRVATPVLMVTARMEASDIVLSLEAGADDYVTKPFEIPVLLARVRALLRRAEKLAREGQSERIRLGDFVIDLASHEAYCGEEKLHLTASEFKIVASLVRSQGRVLTRENLIDLARGEDVSVVSRAIDTHIFGIRRKMGGCSDLIETVRGVGYRINFSHPTPLSAPEL